MSRPLACCHNRSKVGAALRVLRPGEDLEPRSDEFGFDPEFTDRVKAIALWFYRNYWRVEVEGVSNVPARGRALLVANHAGVVPYDGMMVRTAIMAEHPQPRHARMLVVDWAFAMPFTSILLTRTGNVLDHPDNATTLLERDDLVGVFPEGVKGASKLFRDRYRVQRLGRGGFVQVALRTGAPIIPVAVVGAEEVHPHEIEERRDGRRQPVPGAVSAELRVAAPASGVSRYLVVVGDGRGGSVESRMAMVQVERDFGTAPRGGSQDLA